MLCTNTQKHESEFEVSWSANGVGTAHHHHEDKKTADKLGESLNQVLVVKQQQLKLLLKTVQHIFKDLLTTQLIVMNFSIS